METWQLTPLGKDMVSRGEALKTLLRQGLGMSGGRKDSLEGLGAGLVGIWLTVLSQQIRGGS